MQRIKCEPRADWRERVEALGFDFHTIDNEPYWREDACYSFTAGEIDTLEAATTELHDLCLATVERIVQSGCYAELGLDDMAAQLVESSWRAGEHTLYGRMDLAWDGNGPPKLLEYNADTPTALFEASVVQWHWLEDKFPNSDQFNSIHEKLIACWKEFALHPKMHFTACYDQAEDRATCEYLRDTATQAGLSTAALDIEDIDWSGTDFIDLDNQRIAALFKLYPWEWMLSETFGAYISKVQMHWIEPAWKMLLSNKSILPLLWSYYPDHPNLLQASTHRKDIHGKSVRKPRFGREGEGIMILGPGITEPEVAPGTIYQRYHELPRFDEHYALIGSWVIGNEPAGIGIREDNSPITRNTSCFVPHRFE